MALPVAVAVLVPSAALAVRLTGSRPARHRARSHRQLDRIRGAELQGMRRVLQRFRLPPPLVAKVLATVKRCPDPAAIAPLLRDHPQRRTDESRVRRAERHAAKLAALASDLPDRPVIVDIGSGDGKILARVARALNTPPSRALGLELSPAAAKPAGQARPVGHTPIAGDGAAIPLASRSVDLCTAVMVLHHADRPEQLLQEAFRVLKPGGRLLLRETNASNARRREQARLWDGVVTEIYGDGPYPPPVSLASLRHWTRVLQAAGFEVQVVDGGGHRAPFYPATLIATKPKSAAATAASQEKRR